LARSSIEEVLAAMALPRSASVPPLTMKRRLKITMDWSRLNWVNTSVLAILVFAAALIGNVLFVNNALIAAIAVTLIFVVLYGCVRAGFPALLFTLAARSKSSLAAWRHAHR
jgi:hypothetical protein